MVFVPLSTSAYPYLHLNVLLLKGNGGSIARVPLANMVKSVPWSMGGFIRNYWPVSSGRNPKDPEQAKKWSQEERLWCLLDDKRFMVPCEVVGELPSVEGLQAFDVEEWLPPVHEEKSEEEKEESPDSLWAFDMSSLFK